MLASHSEEGNTFLHISMWHQSVEIYASLCVKFLAAKTENGEVTV